MAVLEDPNTGSMAAVDASKLALRTSLRPFELTGYFAFGAQSGALTGVAANGPVFSLRNAAGNSELVLVRHIGLGFLTTTAFTTPQTVDYGLFVARSFTASDSGGTAISVTGSNTKVRTSLAAPNSLDARIAAAAALTAGTRTLDTNALAQLGAWSGGAGQGIVPVQNNLWDQYTGDQLIVLAPNEGLVIANLTTMGAAGVARLYINVEFAIASAF
ncbi:MAG: hypothetical protein J0H94_08330 [Rhizobiales bacterium]|nr:hypothetical protein [Hyphomicrobiales bacterium]